MSAHTAGTLSTTIPAPKEVKSGVYDGHSSSSGDESESGEEGPVGTTSRRSRHIRAHSEPIGSTEIRAEQPRIMSNREIRREMNRRERGVMQWKGARTLAWVGRNVKDAGRGVKGKLALGLGEGRGKRVGDRGRKVGWGTEV